ncbi:unnamed protein product [marine sediment metagenome]|uniref:Uncharacterized protein n=1 Tax=marine sediment metagenome TaxID=412755 RepID=X1PJ51_9ZZZZ
MAYWLEYYEPLIRAEYDAGYGSGGGVARELGNASTAAHGGDLDGVGTALGLAKLAMQDFIKECLSRRSYRNYYLRDWLVACNNYIDAFAPADPFTMDALINTMLEATPEQVTYFVGLVDAYRQSIWTQPFNHEFFAALARGFETWE